MRRGIFVSGKAGPLLGAAIGAVFMAAGAGAGAQETVSYKYDALGRLVQTTVAGGPVSGQSTGIAYDAAGNRCTYAVASGGGASPTPCPTPPPPSNNPPTAVPDTGAQQRCTTAIYIVTDNDTDPDGDYPLTLTGVTGQNFTVHSSTTIQFTSTAQTGAKVGTYTVQDSRGATATGTLTVTVSGGDCE
jgi:YD repeat-containing protein